MATAKGGSMPSGLGHGKGVPSPADYKVWGVGKRREIPQQAPAPEVDFGLFCRPQNVPFCTYDKIWETICISVPTPNSGGLVPPAPVINAHAGDME